MSHGTLPVPRRAATLALVGLGLSGLGACRLIDQTTFNPEAGKAPVIPPAPPPKPPAPPGPPPLMVIAPDAAPGSYEAELVKQVAAARARKAAVVFDVVEMLPPDADATGPFGAGALAVARRIVALGVPPGRVRLVARPDAGAGAREVRVYVR